ncbi:protein phosphatase 1 regulatory subunit 3C-B-like [Myxocyprinus asiaticus]|uniref:protein phosphatase 1 regulatory subunit 3C-B-like n=1 Tax=Myxocyprinus asiaticus TaxID=70543 RepID=UPI00222207B1|nr:protein phosphatase 1 regulatory subunit 3C-B-like [Myxocyprinus asiaticus]
MTCANVMSRLGSPAMPVTVLSMDLTIGFRCRNSPNFNHLLRVSSPKPLRPCIARHPALEYSHSPSTALITTTKTSRRRKRVAFADSKGLSLITVRLFSEKEETIPCEPLKMPRLKKLNCVKVTPRLRLGFDQPCIDFQSFRSRMQENMVLLESCKVTNHSVMGTVRVRNVCFEKAVHIRITFDTWRSYLDVPCTFLDQCYGEPGTDVFEFNITVPKQITPRGWVEFCVSYLPGGFSDAVWDNNYAKNYCIYVCDA